MDSRMQKVSAPPCSRGKLDTAKIIARKLDIIASVEIPILVINSMDFVLFSTRFGALVTTSTTRVMGKEALA